MTISTIHSRLAAAVAYAGIEDTAGVLEHDAESMPLADAVRLADACGMPIGDLFA